MRRSRKKKSYSPPKTTVPLINDAESIPPNVEIGRTGLRRFGMFVLDDFLQELQSSTRRNQIYREMSDNDATIGAMIFAVKMLCRSVDWYVSPASQEPEDLRAKEFLISCMNDMEITWPDLINEILSFLIYGWSLEEIVYKQRIGPDEEDPSKRSQYSDGLIGWRKISLRAQTTLFGWVFAEDGSGDIVAMRQLSPPDFKMVDIPLSKCLLFRTETSKNNPEGRSILRNAVRAWRFRQNIEVIEGIGIERDLAGLPIVKIPSQVIIGQDEYTKAVYQEYVDLATNIRRDQQEGIVLPSDVYEGTSMPKYDLQLLSAGGSRQIPTTDVIKRYNTQILSTILADFISLGHENIGSRALATTKVDVFTVAIQSFLDIVEEVFNRYAVPRLFALNPSFKISSFPMIKHESVLGSNLELLATYLKALKYAGIPIAINNDMLKYIYSAAGLPDPIKDADDLKQERLQEELLLSGKIPVTPELENLPKTNDTMPEDIKNT
ncbi:MAG: hypothetical protein GYA36_23400 [Veillonellaceae bacterium]|nr:hypothetical protein [Veillonellaceae bacterium]